MKTYDAKDIRNVLLVGHGGSGKTTLLEAMLFTAGAITRMGTVEDGNTVSDHDPDEQRKGISVSLAMAPVEWNGVKINVLDAPGYADFIGDVRSAIRAVDAVIVVVSAVDGVEVQTEAAWELAVEAGLPRAIFVNKLDRERADFQATLDQLVSSFGNQVAPVRTPDRSGARVQRRRRSAAREGRPVPERPQGRGIGLARRPARHGRPRPREADRGGRRVRRRVDRGVPRGGNAPGGAHRRRAPRTASPRARLAPVIVGSATKAMGIDRLLDFIVEEFPSPLDRGPITVIGKDGDRDRARRAIPPAR